MAETLTPEQEAELARYEALSVGQVYLSKQEVFSQDILDTAFIGTDGTDLRGPLAIKNVATATALVNSLDTDSLIRAVWAADRTIAARMTGMGLSQSDLDNLVAIFDRLTQENPPAASQQEMIARAQQPVPDTVGAVPANGYLTATAQIALRLAWIIQSSRTATMQKNDLRKLAFDAAKEKEPSLTAADFGQRIGLDMAGVSGVKRLVHGISGNFFKDLARGVSRLFKNPLAVFKQWGEDIGRGLQALDKPFQWVRDNVPMLGYVLGGVGTAVLAELGKALEAGTITAFEEQRITFVVGNHLQQAGLVLVLVGSVLQLFPPLGTVIGGALVLIGTLATIAGAAILRLQAMTRQARLNREAYELELARIRALKQQQQDALNDAGQAQHAAPVVAAPAPGINFGYIAAALAAVFMLKG